MLWEESKSWTGHAYAGSNRNVWIFFIHYLRMVNGMNGSSWSKTCKYLIPYLESSYLPMLRWKDGKFYYIDGKRNAGSSRRQCDRCKGITFAIPETDRYATHTPLRGSMATPAFWRKCAGENGVTVVQTSQNSQCQGSRNWKWSHVKIHLSIFCRIHSVRQPVKSWKHNRRGSWLRAMKHLLRKEKP